MMNRIYKKEIKEFFDRLAVLLVKYKPDDIDYGTVRFLVCNLSS